MIQIITFLAPKDNLTRRKALEMFREYSYIIRLLAYLLLTSTAFEFSRAFLRWLDGSLWRISRGNGFQNDEKHGTWMHATLSYQQHARKPYYVTRPKWQLDLTSQGKGVDFKFSTRYIQISLQRRLKLLFVYIHRNIANNISNTFYDLQFFLFTFLFFVFYAICIFVCNYIKKRKEKKML